MVVQKCGWDQAPIDFHAYWRFTDSLYRETMILCDYAANGYILLEGVAANEQVK